MVVRSVVLMRRLYAMVVVTEAVRGRSALRESKGNRWVDHAKCIRHGKKNCRSHTEFFRDPGEHWNLFDLQQSIGRIGLSQATLGSAVRFWPSADIGFCAPRRLLMTQVDKTCARPSNVRLGS